jgi:uncharacterized protein YneF (UPF0154 family)
MTITTDGKVCLLVGIILASVIIASLPTVTTAQPMLNSSIEEQLMTALLKTSGQNSSQSQITNSNLSELAQAVYKIVDADPSCNILLNTCAR